MTEKTPGQRAWEASVAEWGPGAYPRWDAMGEHEQRKWEVIAAAARADLEQQLAAVTAENDRLREATEKRTQRLMDLVLGWEADEIRKGNEFARYRHRYAREVRAILNATQP